jgi:hypothetical protein
MSSLNVEDVDLAVLSRQLAQRVEGGARNGALAGRTAFRDATVDVLHCSALEAEQIVDTLVARNFLVFRDEAWDVRPDAS